MTTRFVQLLAIIGLLHDIGHADWSTPVLVDSLIDIPRASLEARNDSIWIMYGYEFIRSIDRGETWEMEHTFETTFWFDNGFELEGDTLTVFFGQQYPFRRMWLYFSDDFGVTWQGPRYTPVYPGPSGMSCNREGETLYQAAVAPLHDGGLVSLSISYDFGLNWSMPESVFFYDTWAYPVMYKFYSRLFVVNEVGLNYRDSNIQLLRSNDEGQNWVSHDSLTPIGSNILPTMDASTYGRMAIVYNDWWQQMTNDSRIYICVSSDSGTTWSNPIDLSDSTINQYPALSMQGDTIVVGWHGNSRVLMRRSFDLGQTWQSVEVVDTSGRNADVDFDGNTIHVIYHKWFNGSMCLFYTRWEPDTVSVHEIQLPEMISFLTAYPNPFNSSTAISYSLAATGRVALSIYNIIGQKVATLFSGMQQAGGHKVIWDAAGVPSGVYFARLESDWGSRSIKMVLLR